MSLVSSKLFIHNAAMLQLLHPLHPTRDGRSDKPSTLSSNQHLFAKFRTGQSKLCLKLK